MFVERRTLAVLEAEYRPVLSNARLLAVPRPVGMNASVEVLAHRLHLPLDPVAMPELHPVPGRGGLEALWAIDSPSGLRLPSYVVDELNFQRAWGIGLLSTPRSLGCVYPRQELTQVAWMVMAMAPVDHVVGLMCGLAATLDEIRGDPAFSVPLALMAAPGEYTGRLVATARRGEPWLYGRCLRWIARERAVAGNACPWNGPPAWPLFAAFFPSLVVGGHPTDADLVRAAWFLHESFDGGGLPDGADKHQAAATATALTYRLPRPGGWLSRLAHWSSVWQVEDRHTDRR